jgi:hypothetical protein
VASEGQAGRGLVREDRGRDSGSAAEEWAEVEAGRGQVRAAEERELEVPEEEAVQLRAEVCGKAARVEVRVAAQVPVAGREEVARAAEEERVQVLAEGGQALEAAQDRAAGAALAQELVEAELDRAERERQENG